MTRLPSRAPHSTHWHDRYVWDGPLFRFTLWCASPLLRVYDWIRAR